MSIFSKITVLAGVTHATNTELNLLPGNQKVIGIRSNQSIQKSGIDVGHCVDCNYKTSAFASSFAQSRTQVKLQMDKAQDANLWNSIEGDWEVQLPGAPVYTVKSTGDGKTADATFGEDTVTIQNLGRNRVSIPSFEGKFIKKDVIQFSCTNEEFIEVLKANGQKTEIQWIRKQKVEGMDMKKIHVLFICSGNTCRSPMAQALLLDQFQKLGIQHYASVSSCGYSADDVGKSESGKTINMHGHATEALKNKNIVPDQHFQSRTCTDQILQQADIIYAVCDKGLNEIQTGFPSLLDLQAESVHIAKSISQRLGTENMKDPFKGSVADYEKALDSIEQSINARAQEIANKVMIQFMEKYFLEKTEGVKTLSKSDAEDNFKGYTGLSTELKDHFRKLFTEKEREVAIEQAQ